MKNFYSIAAVALMAMAANAQNGAPLYITGQGFTPEWSAVEPNEFTWDAATSTYVFEGENLSSFAISTAKGSEEASAWDVFNGNRMQATAIDKNGQWCDLTAGTSNILAPYPTVAPSKGKIEVKGDLSQVKITMESAQTSWGVYIRGGMNNWLNGDDWAAQRADWQLKPDPNDENTYYLNLKDGQVIEAEVDFKIADQNWAWVNFGLGDGNTDPRELDVPSTLDYNGATNITLAEECTGSVVIVLNPEGLMEPAEITFSNDPYMPSGVASIVTEDENAPVKYFNMQGVQIDEPANGLYIQVKGSKSVKVIK